MGIGEWDETKNSTYNLVDAVSRSTVQVSEHPADKKWHVN